MTTHNLRVALIGAGGIGAIRAAALAQTAGLTLAYVVDIDQARADQVTAAHGGIASTDAHSAITKPDVDLVIVSTPPNLHGDLTIAALDAKKHVICEKPLAHTLADAERMVAAAERNGVRLMTGFNHRYFPPMQYARALIDTGKIGDVISVQAYAGHPGGAEFGHEWVTNGQITGGGALVDNGIHILDLTRYFFGEVTRGKGYITNLVWQFPTAEDNAYALFTNPVHQVAQVHASWTHWRGYRWWVEILGTRGYARATYPPMSVEWGQTPEPGIRTKRQWEWFPTLQIQERLKSWRFTAINSFVREMTDVTHDILTGAHTAPSGFDGLRALQMAHAIYISSQQGIEVDV